MNKSIYFVRHGLKESSNTNNSITNKLLPLAKEGCLQSRLVGIYLKKQSVEVLYSSDYVRAMESATIINETLQISHHIDASYGERILFIHDVDIQTSKDEFIKSQEDWSYHPDGGESLQEVYSRFNNAVNSIMETGQREVAVITHGRALQTYLSCTFPNAGFNDAELLIEPCDVYRVDYQDGIPVQWNFVFAPMNLKNKVHKITTLADTLVTRNLDTKKVEKTHLIGTAGHDVQANIYEKLSLDLLHSTGLLVPGNRVLIDRGRSISMNFISGDTLGTLLSKSVNVQSSMRRIGKILRDFHDNINQSNDYSSPINIHTPDPELNLQCALNFTQLTSKNLNVRNSSPFYDSFVISLKIANQVVKNNQHYLESRNIIYGDFKPDNILISHQKIYMIDPHLSYGRLSCDLGKMIARLYLTNPQTAAKNVDALLKGYKPDAHMLREIRDMAGFDILNTFSRLVAKKQLSSKLEITSHRSTLENMEKCLRDVVPELFNNGDILVLRHLDDIQDFRVHYRNTPILQAEEERIPDISQKILSVSMTKGKSKIQLITSDQVRTTTTAKLVSDQIKRLAPQIKVNITDDIRIKDLYHGRYVIPEDYVVGTKLPALSLATKAYIDQTFTHRNLDYKNGDPFEGAYPSLTGLFSEYGETQRSFSIRFYQFMSAFLEDISASPDTLYVVVAHTAIVFRLFELYFLVRQLADEQSDIDKGEISFNEWQQTVHLDSNPGNQLFIAPGEIKQLPLGSLLGYSWRFNDEVAYLNEGFNLKDHS